MKVYEHPTIGKFILGDEGYTQQQKSKIGKFPLLLDSDFGPKQQWDANREAAAKVATRFYDRIDQLVIDALDQAAKRLLKGCNIVRNIEGKAPLTSDQLKKKLKLIDVCVSPEDFVVTFEGRAFDDEHNLFRIRYGPKGGLREAYIE
ncbi:hypothetical protein C5Y96_04430 [Blastopirellula marina]|uniref:Uncharacterized protein n=1 Tax=Blastopirellula marina TaxID=124 RepID=A0A2S8G4P2_9BACT|nr:MULTISPECIES: hypothetical protein [Pirellulaceae]PQO39114.1 hypothetical protein C5Y96_04430 [Blastopirellula marina]RCS55422.1 hypothetical protein DTL36_04440 [Bremerella cremea]